MFRTHRLDTDARFSVGLETCHVAQHQTHLVRRFQTLHHLLVKLFTIFKEMIHRTLFTAGRHQRLDADGIRLDVITGFARQDHQLTHHVFTGEVNARIGFR